MLGKMLEKPCAALHETTCAAPRRRAAAHAARLRPHPARRVHLLSRCPGASAAGGGGVRPVCAGPPPRRGGAAPPHRRVCAVVGGQDRRGGGVIHQVVLCGQGAGRPAVPAGCRVAVAQLPVGAAVSGGGRARAAASRRRRCPPVPAPELLAGMTVLMRHQLPWPHREITLHHAKPPPASLTTAPASGRTRGRQPLGRRGASRAVGEEGRRRPTEGRRDHVV